MQLFSYGLLKNFLTKLKSEVSASSLLIKHFTKKKRRPENYIFTMHKYISMLSTYGKTLDVKKHVS